jgi:cell division protein FtsL
MSIYIIALIVCALFVAGWFIRQGMDAARLRREVYEWRQSIARQREIFKAEDDDTKPYPGDFPEGGAFC